MNFLKKGFTLVELLVVMAILGVLVTLIAGNFRSAQIRGRDVQRKSDLKQISNALELFFNDYGYYPPADSDGRIMACPFEEGVGGVSCNWGVEGDIKFEDKYPGSYTTRTVYLTKIPDDPVTSYHYYYRQPGGDIKKFQLFAKLENPEDPDCMEKDCANPPVTYACGTVTCNFSITSGNTTYSE